MANWVPVCYALTGSKEELLDIESKIRQVEQAVREKEQAEGSDWTGCFIEDFARLIGSELTQAELGGYWEYDNSNALKWMQTADGEEYLQWVFTNKYCESSRMREMIEGAYSSVKIFYEDPFGTNDKDERYFVPLVKLTNVDGLNYFLGNDGTAMLNCDDCIKGKVLNVPEQIECNGKTYQVTSFGDAFADPQYGSGTIAPRELEEIFFPAGVKEVAGYCTSPSTLKAIHFAGDVDCIGDYAFCGCKQLSSVEFAGKVNTIEYEAFAYTSIRDINIPEGAKVDPDAFTGSPLGLKSDVIKIKNKFTEASVFEVLGKERSETVHSAFLRWLIEGKSVSYIPNQSAQLFLNLVAQRALTQKRADVSLCNMICGGGLKIADISARTEVSVKSLAADAQYDYMKSDPDRAALLKSIASEKEGKGSDRMDLVVDMNVAGCPDVDHLQIIIENKVDSMEGGPKKTVNITGYDDLPQTERYYVATKRQKAGLKQIYVFLDATPASDLDILDWSVLDQKCSSDKFVMICYQDILDKLVTPLLSSGSLSTKAVLLLEDYRNELTFPSLSQQGQLLAVDYAYKDAIMRIWKKYYELLAELVFCIVDEKCYIIDGLFTTDVRTAKIALAKSLLPEYERDMSSREWISNTACKGYEDLGNGYWFKTTTWFSKLKEFAHGKCTVMETSGFESTEEEIACTEFWECNKDFLTRLMQIVKYIAGQEDNFEEIRKTDLLLSILNRRDTTKYNVVYNGAIQNENPLGKADAALTIVNCWLKENPGSTLDDLRAAFPIDCSDYYSHGKWFKYLFYEYKEDYSYEYDGTEASGTVNGYWDFHKDNKRSFTLEDGKQVVMLKMWRKSSLNGLLKHLYNVLKCSSIDVMEA